ncbi:MAG: hypothetical protein DWB42_05765 [Chloroflexi bacterium]|nr:hypothetical protein [Chloroflexota bacterium]MDL1883078.1 hypothetical protein [Anaerolineae bacterium CFX8]
MRRLGAVITSALVIGIGLLTVAGLVVGGDLGWLSAIVEAFRIRDISGIFLQLAVITAATTILIGILNLLVVHLRRVGRREKGWAYSLLLVISALGVIILAVLERAGVLASEPPLTTILFESVQVSIESALAGLVLFALVYGAYRLMRRGVTWPKLLFVLVLLFMLLAALPLPGPGLLASARDWLMAVPVSAGARGILLGIALATVVTGVRVLIGLDRSYRE